MKESISYTFLLNIIIVFIAISFFAIMGIIGYSKAYRVNSKIVNTIETNEGYNAYSIQSIRDIITSYGYQKYSINCPNKDGQAAISGAAGAEGYCVYRFDEGNVYSYGVTTYMTFDFPIVGRLFRIPVYTKTATIRKLG
ncbi:MAG: hypothetical protein E7173_01700 [Firmicutes bacterium]|nr:hypothetical protein [Bacillota bacterium]